MHVLGVDAAWTAGGCSGVALVERGARGRPRLLRIARSYGEFLSAPPRWLEKPPAAAATIADVLAAVGVPLALVALVPLQVATLTGRREAEHAVARAYARAWAAPAPLQGGAAAALLAGGEPRRAPQGHRGRARRRRVRVGRMRAPGRAHAAVR